MRGFSILSIVFMSTLTCVVALADPIPDTVLFAGFVYQRTINPSANGTWCMIDGSNTTFVQSQTPKTTLISFPDIVYTQTGSLGPTAYRLSGQGNLVFKSDGTSGTIGFLAKVFTYPTSVAKPAFNNYSQNYDAATRLLTVKFSILFQGCTLPYSAAYRN